MSTSLTMRGTLEVGGEGCASSCGGADRTIYQLALRCATQFYQSVVEAPVGIRIQTTGLPGAEFVDLEILGDLEHIEFLYLKTDQPIVVRTYAEVAEVEGSGAAFGTVLNGETLTLEIDGVAVSVEFVVPGDTTGAAIVARINAACALAGLATPRCELTSGGQLKITGILTGPEGSVEITGGTAAAKVGLSGLSDVGSGSDEWVYGTKLVEFDPQNAPSRVQVSGVGSIKLLAAGRTS